MGILAAKLPLQKLAVPKRTAPMLVAQKSAKEVELFLEKEVEAALMKLARPVEYGVPSLDEDTVNVDDPDEPIVNDTPDPADELEEDVLSKPVKRKERE